MTTSADVAGLGAWVARSALEGEAEAAILEGLCERLDAAGLRIARVSVAGNLLDPVLDARLLTYRRGEAALEDTVLREGARTNEDWLRSPFRVLLEGNSDLLRRRLDASYHVGEFPLLDQFQREGMTDYAAFATRLGPAATPDVVEGMLSSWTTDADAGFGDDQISLLAGLVPTLALVFVLRTARRTAHTLVATYLGQDAAQRVLAGNIVRGQAESIRAVVWFSDLAGFTRVSEEVGAAGVLALLNDYAEAAVEAIETHEGHVLKFIGDAILAIFPDDADTSAAARALDAAVEHGARIAAVNARRTAAGLPVVETHVALHMGDLLYGNVGSPRRLDFTVLGPAVNEAARIEALCGSLEKRVIASAAFAQAAGPARSRLVSLGRYALKGVARPQEMFTLDPG